MTRDPLEIASAILKLAPCGLFDRAWYLITYQTAFADGGDPLVHFCDRGWRQNCDPNFYFRTAQYRAGNLDVEAAQLNPLLHYLEYGEAENRAPSGHFDPGWYRANYQLAPGVSALADYLEKRTTQKVNPNPGFDAAWYTETYPEDIEGADPFEDYIRRGAAAGRDPSPDARLIRNSGVFDTAYYHAQYPDAAAQDMSPIYHFCRSGWRKEGCNPNPLFDTKWYLATHVDVGHAGINPLVHYIRFGEPENRPPSVHFDPAAYRQEHSLPPDISALVDCLRRNPPSTANIKIATAPEPEPEKTGPVWMLEAGIITKSELFDINYYLTNYPDIRESKLDPLEHFCRYGWQEGRRPNTYFDPAWYAKTYLSETPAVNPLAHYAASGERRGNRPIVYFDPVWYRQEYQLARNESALLHFLQNRRSQKYSPLELFDVERYISLHGTKIGANRDPFAYFLRVGISSDTDPGPNFDARQYRLTAMGELPPRARPVAGAEIHEKLRRETFNPLVHYLLNNFTAAENKAAPIPLPASETPAA